MEITEEKAVAVILVGGPTKGTRSRILSFNTPEPLFPLAGQPMVGHLINSCKRIPNLAQVFLVGFYEEREFAIYASSISNELKVPVRYLKEDKPHGSGGSLYYCRDQIMEESPSHIFMLNHDVCCSFPLPNMLEAHISYGGMGTILVVKVSAESANQFGELVADPITKELLHYTEKPETFVSDLINCGVYVFTPQIFSAIQEVYMRREAKANISHTSSFDFQLATRSLQTDFVRLDQDILSPLAGKKQLYTYETMDFWEQINTPGMAIKCSALYLAQFRVTSPHLLANGDGKKNATVVGDVYIHPSAKVHPTAKIGPNVSISANVRIAAGARLISCIVLDDAEIKENAVIMHAIVGWKSSLGRWSRVQADGDYNTKFGTTILGEAVAVEDSIVLPNKMLNYFGGDLSGGVTNRSSLFANLNRAMAGDHQHRPHRISLPPRATILNTTSSTPLPSHPLFRYPPSTPTPTPSKRLPISRHSTAPTSFPFLFLLLFSLRSLYSLLPFLRSSPPSFSIFPFSFLVSLLSFLLTLLFSIFTSNFAKNSSYLKSQRPIFSLTSITQSQLKLLVAKSLLLAVVFLLRFQALRYCGTAAMILAELSGNMVSRFMTDGKDRSFANMSSIGSSKVRGFIALFSGLLLLSVSWDRIECFPLSHMNVSSKGLLVFAGGNCLRIWPMLLPFLSGFLGYYERVLSNWRDVRDLGAKRVHLVTLFFTTVALFIPAVISMFVFEAEGDSISLPSLGWPLANIVVFGVLLSENFTDEKVAGSKDFQREYFVTFVCTLVLELLYFPELSLWGLLICGLLLWISVRELDPVNFSYHELGFESSESFSATVIKPIRHVLSERKSRKIALFLLINTTYMVVEFVAGFMSNSLGLISDACHMLFDCAALAIGLYASYISRLTANSQFNYGRGRFEVLSGYVNAVFLVLVGALITLESLERILDPQEISTSSLLAVSIGGLVVNIVGLIFFHEEHHHAHGGSGACSHSHSHSHSHSETHFQSHTESKAHSHCHHHNHDHRSHEDDEFEDKHREFFTVVKDSNEKLGSNHDSEYSFDHEHNCHHDADRDDHRHDHQHDDQQYHRHHHADKPNHDHHHNGHYNHHHHHSHVDQYDDNHGPTEPLLERKEKEKHHHHIDHNMRGIFLHILADTLGSVGVVISTLLIKYKGWLIADPACSIFISALIVLSVIPLLRNSAEILMQRVPRFCEHELKEAINKVMKLKGMVGVQNLHVWSFTNTDVVGTIHLHVSVDSDKTSAKNQVLHIFHDAGVKDLTVQVELVGSNQKNQG